MSDKSSLAVRSTVLKRFGLNLSKNKDNSSYFQQLLPVIKQTLLTLSNTEFKSIIIINYLRQLLGFLIS